MSAGSIDSEVSGPESVKILSDMEVGLRQRRIHLTLPRFCFFRRSRCLVAKMD